MGNEYLAGIGVDTPIPKLKLEYEEGEFYSAITNTTEYYDSNKINTTIELAGVDVYLIVGASASISFNYSTFNEMCVKIWSE